MSDLINKPVAIPENIPAILLGLAEKGNVDAIKEIRHQGTLNRFYELISNMDDDELTPQSLQN